MRNVVIVISLFFAAMTYATPLEIIEYKEVADGENLKLHIAKPEGWQASDQRPTVVFFFGGGWVSGSPTQFYPFAQELAKHGMVGIAAQYRTKKSHGTTPVECVKDGNSAIRYVRENAAELGVDPEKILAGGGSAGGHIALCTAIQGTPEEEGEDLGISSKPAALVLLNPVIDTGPKGFAHASIVAAMGDDWLQLSPIDCVGADMPPTLYQLGTEDHIIPVENSEAFKEKMLAAGVRCDVIYYEGQGHSFFNKEPYLTQTKDQIVVFLTDLGYIQ